MVKLQHVCETERTSIRQKSCFRSWLSTSDTNGIKRDAIGSTIKRSSESVDTVSVLDKTSSVMDDDNMQNSFYSQQIFGDPFAEESSNRPNQQSSDCHHLSVNIDPVVRNKSTSSSRLDSISQTSLEKLSGPTGLLAHRSHHRPISGARSTGRLFSPPPFPTGHYREVGADGTLMDKIVRPTSEKRSPMVQTRSKTITDYYSYEDGLNWEINHTDDRPSSRQSSDRINLSHLSSDKYQANTLQEKAEGLVTNQETSQKLVHEENNNGKYRTVLYVVPTSPREQNRSYWASKKLKDRNNSGSQPRLSNHGHSRNQTSFVQERDNRPDTPNSSIDESLSTSADVHSSDLNINLPRNDRTKIIFQGPGRYLEQKPYYQTIPSPRQMNAIRPTNEFHSLVNRAHDMSNFSSPSPIQFTRTDYNQVVVDIKPRQLHEADKQQHVSQWIQVGTLGDTITQRADGLGSIPDDLNSDALDFDDPADGDNNGDYPDLTLPTNGNEKLRMSDDPVEPVRIVKQQQTLELYRGDTEARGSVPQRAVCDTIFEEPSTPETGHTNSVRSNVMITVNGNTKQSSKESLRFFPDRYEGVSVSPVPTYRAKLTFLPAQEDVSRDVAGANGPTNSKPPRAKSNPATPVHWSSGRRVSDPHCSPVNGTPVSESRPMIENEVKGKFRPNTAPKPSPQEQLAAILGKRPLTTTGTEIRHVNSQVSSHIISPTFFHGTFPRTTQNTPRPKWDTSEAFQQPFDDEPRDTPVPNVRNLAAFFTDLIKRQNDPQSSSSSGRRPSHDSNETNCSEEKDLPVINSPFLLHQENATERERRLRAVETLRTRSTPLPTVDYTKIGTKQNANTSRESSFEDYHPYTRPSSAPRHKVKYMTTKITRNVTLPISNH
ncbi:hypothetical protein PHET_00721 [Paragonimus heterotremus]|uniref:Uncharacterized protein n=1 Tax=Paragonimus heterotremus TaxID=100268 RepID=A0A8J4WJQ2_9TREM|nr:hypothetical protein PHET_00721 [Paragonimus heterotremus]